MAGLTGDNFRINLPFPWNLSVRKTLIFLSGNPYKEAVDQKPQGKRS